MSAQATDFTRQNYKWMKSDSGSTYLCEVAAIRGLDNPTEKQLSSLCVDESQNPQNE